MNLNSETKLKIQEKLIRELTNENNLLKEKVTTLEKRVETIIEKYDEEFDNVLDSKSKFENLVDELEKQKIEYRIMYDMYRRLTNIK